MSDEYKVAVTALTGAMLVLLALVAALVNAGIMNHDFDVKCLQSGNRIQYQVLEGYSQPVKECK